VYFFGELAGKFCQELATLLKKQGCRLQILLQVEDFIKLAKEQAASFLTNNIMMTMGEDFNYQGIPQGADPPLPLRVAQTGKII
jgi:hypothetical protein